MRSYPGEPDKRKWYQKFADIKPAVIFHADKAEAAVKEGDPGEYQRRLHAVQSLKKQAEFIVDSMQERTERTYLIEEQMKHGIFGQQAVDNATIMIQYMKGDDKTPQG